MKLRSNISDISILVSLKITFIFFLLSIFWITPVFAHSSPNGCTGSGLGINLFSSTTRANIGDIINYSLTVFNGSSVGPIVCDATSIQAHLVTPDGISHSITLIRTALSNGESDNYSNIVTYAARAQDVTTDGTLTATASDTGIIHQNLTDSQGGSNQGINVYLLNTLHIIKVVANNNGGTAAASGFTLHVKDAGVDVVGSPATGTAAPGTLYSLIAGTYNISENVNASYAQSFSGDCDSNGDVILLGGNDKTCTITNTDIPPASINVVKTVINDNNGTKVVSDFPLFVDGNPILSGVTNIFPPGAHTVTETADQNYTATFSLDCSSGGHINLLPGDNKFCVITNDDIVAAVVTPQGSGPLNPVPPLIDVTKIPDPLALSNGPGTVKYTYTLRNIGTVPVINITMVDDSCSPVTLFSGDINNDAKLDLNETWIYECSTTLSQTHTNTVVATGWANNISAVDLASANVIVGSAAPGLPNTGSPNIAGIIPPLIHVTKIPSPSLLRGGSGTVIYTETITNPGTVVLSNVRLSDDKCSPVNYISGDANSDSRLDPTEIWTYACQTNLNKTTTNTVTATGDANGLTAKDFAIATVVVTVPGLPKTGFPPKKRSIQWNSLINFLENMFI